jgi:outer membrane protein
VFSNKIGQGLKTLWCLRPRPRGPLLGNTGAVADRFSTTLEIGGGIGVSPAYEGATRYTVSPVPVISLHSITIPGILSFDKGNGQGFSVKPTLVYRGERDANDDAALAGLDTVDPAYEAGVRLAYRHGPVRVFAEGRQGFGGHTGFVGQVGTDLVAEPTNTTTVSLGPRASLATNSYMDTYFGVTPAEAARSTRLGVHDPSAGIKGVGLAGSIRQEFRPNWFANADAGYERLVGDAATSPIVAAGSRDQWTGSLSLSHRFSIGQ